MDSVVSTRGATVCRVHIKAAPEEVRKYAGIAWDRLSDEAPEGASIESLDEGDAFLSRVLGVMAREVIGDAARLALEKQGRYPVERIRLLSELRPRLGEALVADVEVDVLPELSFPDFSSMKLDVLEPDIPRSNLYRAIEFLMRSSIRIEEVHEVRRPMPGDLALFSVEAVCDGCLVPGLSVRRGVMPIDYAPAGEARQQVEQVLRALRPGESGEAEILCPEDHPLPMFRGRSVHARVTLEALRHRVIPPLTDEVAAKSGFKNVHDLKKMAMGMTMDESIRSRKASAQEKLLAGIPGIEDTPVPESLARFHEEGVRRQMKAFIRESGETRPEMLRSLLSAAGDEIASAARTNAARQCYLLAYAWSHGLSVNEKSLDERIEAMAAQARRDAKEFRADLEKNGVLDSVRDGLLADEAMEHIYGQVHKIMVDASGAPVPAPRLSSN